MHSTIQFFDENQELFMQQNLDRYSDPNFVFGRSPYRITSTYTKDGESAKSLQIKLNYLDFRIPQCFLEKRMSSPISNDFKKIWNELIETLFESKDNQEEVLRNGVNKLRNRLLSETGTSIKEDLIIAANSIDVPNEKIIESDIELKDSLIKVLISKINGEVICEYNTMFLCGTMKVVSNFK